MLVEHIDEVKAYLNHNEVVDTYPRGNDREAWAQIPETLVTKLIENGNQLIGYDWPVLKASEYLEFFDDGVHGGVYHKKFMKRRNMLGELMMAECVEGKGRYLKDIINGIYVICEESTWVVPQHNAILNEVDEIDKKTPSMITEHIDLFAAETGSLLTWCQYLLKEQLDGISVNVCHRINDELMKRIIKPYLKSDQFHWMGFIDTTGANGNWNPWINCNCMTTFLYGCKDKDLRVQGVEKILKSTQKYADFIGEEGGCNEGPTYWTVAAGMLFDLMVTLSHATDKTVDFFNNDKFKNMGKYIYRLYIGDHTYVNFADAPAKDNGTKDGGLLYRYGVASGDSLLMDLGATVFKRNFKILYNLPNFQLSLTNNCFRTNWNFWNLINYEAMMTHEGNAPFVRDAYIGDVEVAIAREKEGSDDGFFLCAKGGNNKESHNHNDVGHFVLYCNSKPVCIDPGAMPYTLDYFREGRYTMKYWVTRSDYHNTPIINGQVQKEGLDHRATEATYQCDHAGMDFAVNLEACYPAEAKVESWRRTFRLERLESPSVTVTDSFRLREESDQNTVVLMTPRKVHINEEGNVVFESYEGSHPVTLEVDNALLEIEVETLDLKDTPKLMGDWGEALYRVLLKSKTMVKEATYRMTFTENMT